MPLEKRITLVLENWTNICENDLLDLLFDFLPPVCTGFYLRDRQSCFAELQLVQIWMIGFVMVKIKYRVQYANDVLNA